MVRSHAFENNFTHNILHLDKIFMAYCRSGFDCEILMIVNYELFFSRARNQKNHIVILSVYYYTVQVQPSQLLNLQFGLTILKLNH